MSAKFSTRDSLAQDVVATRPGNRQSSLWYIADSTSARLILPLFQQWTPSRDWVRSPFPCLCTSMHQGSAARRAAGADHLSSDPAPCHQTAETSFSLCAHHRPTSPTLLCVAVERSSVMRNYRNRWRDAVAWLPPPPPPPPARPPSPSPLTYW